MPRRLKVPQDLPTSHSRIDDDSFLTKQEVQKWLRVSEERVTEWIRSGRIKSLKTGDKGGRYLIRAKWVRDFIGELEKNL